MERIQRLMGDHPQPGGPPPVQPDDPSERYAAFAREQLPAVPQIPSKSRANGIPHRRLHQVQVRHLELKCQSGGNFHFLYVFCRSGHFRQYRVVER